MKPERIEELVFECVQVDWTDIADAIRAALLTCAREAAEEEREQIKAEDNAAIINFLAELRALRSQP